MAAETRIALIFHGLGTPARPLEPGEAPFWLPVDLFERVLDQVAMRPQAFHLTFDDGNLSDHDIALPRLRDRGLGADFFVLSGRIGQPGSLSADHVRALCGAGMGIGSHGIGHRNLTQLPDADLRQELSQSRQQLQALIQAPVAALGIPFGAYDARVLRAIRAAGYAVAWSSDRGTTRMDGFLRPRTSLRGDMDLAAVAAVLSGQLSLPARLRRGLGMARRRLIGRAPVTPGAPSSR